MSPRCLHPGISGNISRITLAKPLSGLSVVIALFAFVCSSFTVSAQQKSAVNMDEAIDLAIEHNHALKSARTLILQNQAQEITANLRPNPVLQGDAQFLPIFTPNAFNSDTFDQASQFDLGVSYLWERGGKRQNRLLAAKDQTAVTRYQVSDNERGLVFNVATQFIGALLAKANVELAEKDLDSFKQTVEISEYQLKVGQISEGDQLKIKLQLLQFQQDLAGAQLARVQAMAALRQLIGYDVVPENYQIDGDLKYMPLTINLEDIQLKAISQRPDYLAAKQGIAAANSQYNLAVANAKKDVTTALLYSHVGGVSSASTFFNMEIPVFDRGQGEKARTKAAITQAEETEKEANEQVMTDIRNAYEGYKVNQQVIQLYDSGYLKNAQDSRDISEYAYKRGAASLLDFLDAERSYRAIELAYRQALAAYMLGIEQLKQSAGLRRLP